MVDMYCPSWGMSHLAPPGAIIPWCSTLRRLAAPVDADHPHIIHGFGWRTRNGEDPLERRKEPRYLLNHSISKGSDTISTELIDILSKSCNPNGLRYLGVTSMPMFSLRSTMIPLSKNLCIC